MASLVVDMITEGVGTVNDTYRTIWALHRRKLFKTIVELFL